MPGPPTRRTRQLLLRAPEPADAEALFAIQGNAEAMRHTYCAPSLEATAAYIESYAARFAEDGFAPWTALLLEPEPCVAKQRDAAQQRIVGWGGLNKDPSAPEWGTEVAYYIDRAYWSRGLATELVRESLTLAFGDIDLERVGAFTRPANVASARVLVKNGFERTRFVAELERDEYLIVRDYWHKRVNEARAR